jgi:hypothetical protein
VLSEGFCDSFADPSSGSGDDCERLVWHEGIVSVWSELKVQSNDPFLW